MYVKKILFSVYLLHTVDTLRCAKFDCNVCNLCTELLAFKKACICIQVLFVRVSETDLFLNDSTVKQKRNWR